MSNSIFDQLGFTTVELGEGEEIMSVEEGMTVVPIRIQGNNDSPRNLSRNVARPERMRFRGTREGYGRMTFENTDPDHDVIVPANTMVLSDQSAQDHATSEVGIVKKSSPKTFDNCCCVQQSQGGYLTADHDGHHYDVLPYQLRKALLNATLRRNTEYGKLWKHIDTFLKPIPNISHSGGHMEYFFKPYAKDLEDFAAQFEPVENQIGGVVLFGNKVVGVEIMPSVEHWEFYWKWLIRGCYGAQMMQYVLSGSIKKSQLELPRLSGDFNDVRRIIANYMESLKLQIMKALTQHTFKGSIGTGKELLKPVLLKSTKGDAGGDMIIENTQSPVYLSLVL